MQRVRLCDTSKETSQDRRIQGCKGQCCEVLHEIGCRSAPRDEFGSVNRIVRHHLAFHVSKQELDQELRGLHVAVLGQDFAVVFDVVHADHSARPAPLVLVVVWHVSEANVPQFGGHDMIPEQLLKALVNDAHSYSSNLATPGFPFDDGDGRRRQLRPAL